MVIINQFITLPGHYSYCLVIMNTARINHNRYIAHNRCTTLFVLAGHCIFWLKDYYQLSMHDLNSFPGWDESWDHMGCIQIVLKVPVYIFSNVTRVPYRAERTLTLSLKRMVQGLVAILGVRKSWSKLAGEGRSKGKPMARRSGYLRSRIPQYEAASLHLPTRSWATWKLWTVH